MSIANSLKPDCSVTMGFGGELYTHQVIVPDNLYPGAVIEQIAIQNKGLAAGFRRDLSVGKNVFVYSVATE